MNESISRKIQALLAKTSDANCTEEEARTALTMASRLASQYNISMEEIKSGGGKSADEWEELDIHDSGKWTLDIEMANAVINKYFFVKSVMIKKETRGTGRGFTLVFYGRKENVATAKFVFNGLLMAFRNLWQSYRDRTGCDISLRYSFLFGVTNGVSDRLKSERTDVISQRDKQISYQGTGTAIMLQNIEQELNARFNEKYNDLTKSKSNLGNINYNPGVTQAGYDAGKALNIRRSIDKNKHD